MLRKKITGAKYFSDSTKQMTNLNIATPVFTLEDGSTVTKKIRVLSSTTTPAT